MLCIKFYIIGNLEGDATRVTDVSIVKTLRPKKKRGLFPVTRPTVSFYRRPNFFIGISTIFLFSCNFYNVDVHLSEIRAFVDMVTSISGFNWRLCRLGVLLQSLFVAKNVNQQIH